MNVYLLAISFCLVFIFISVELIRRQKLQEQYAILWLILGFIMALFSLFPSLLDQLSYNLHIHYAPSLLFLVGLLFSLAFIMHLTLVISKLHRKLTRLVQEVALLQEQLHGGDSK
ncbi:DUF2304 domain-containing protein [Paenibacillus aceris]|uniref:DUF2304 domain-containing protein n=1 Tax=Paenibacillus aceris TaxID=869555 RepID=A0ABS4HSD4_9BACL|nr:DUF2304 domain-containing protein [Paenibacillus aceris]MBP1961316.1 hypothetical protein [Paenibacillus aceris]NHW37896.1 DUF2304 domain-containing protein [Paenibacillus aceris]